MDGCQFQCELTNVTPVVFIKLDETEIYCLVCLWVDTEGCNVQVMATLMVI